jgi:hypothetical protein
MDKKFACLNPDYLIKSTKHIVSSQANDKNDLL